MAEPVGRPTVMDENTLNKLEGAFADGASDKLACFLANISHQTLYNYQELHPEFVERKEYLKDQVKFQARKVVRDAIQAGDKQQANWYLERKDKEFKSKTDITSDDAPLQPVLVKFLNDKPTNDNRDTV